MSVFNEIRKCVWESHNISSSDLFSMDLLAQIGAEGFNYFRFSEVTKNHFHLTETLLWSVQIRSLSVYF